MAPKRKRAPKKRMDEDEAALAQGPQKSVALTQELLDELVAGVVERHSTKSLKALVQAFHSAVHVSDTGAATQYEIADGEVYHAVCVAALKHVHGGLCHHLGVAPDASPSAPLQNLEAHPKLGKLKAVLKTWFGALLHLVKTTSDPALIGFVLSAVEPYVPFLLVLPKYAKLLLKALLKHWAKAPPLDADAAHAQPAAGAPAEAHRQAQLLAFVRVRQIALCQPHPFVEEALRSAYVAYVRACKTLHDVGSAHLALLRSCMVELCSVDPLSTYQFAFVSIRQLALNLRTAVLKPSKETLGTVCGWQFLHCVALWAQVVGAQPDASQLRPLVHPLVQLVFGAVGVLPVMQYAPLRLHYVRVLHQLAAQTGVYVPTASLLLQTLDAPELGRRGGGAGGEKGAKPAPPPELLKSLQLKKAEIGNHETQTAVVLDALKLLKQGAAIYAKSAAFPELAHMLVAHLRQFNKGAPSAWRMHAGGVSEHLVASAKWAANNRREAARQEEPH